MKRIFTIIIIALLGISQVWGDTLYGKVAVGSGKGEATVEIYNGYTIKEGSESTSGAQVTVSIGMNAVKWGYCKFLASAATGYTFDGWYTNSACTVGKVADNPYQTATSRNENRTDEYWAKFTPNTYKVTFNAEGGTVSPATKNVTFDAAYGDGEGGWPTPERTGYIFEGWFKNDGTTLVEASTTVSAASNLAVYAHWTPITYHVAFDGNGSTTGSMEPQDFTYDAAQDLTANGFAQAYTVQFDAKVSAIEPLVSNSEFIGWATSAQGEKEYDNEQNVSNLTAENDATIQLFALWNAGSVVLPSVEKEGYQFEGWFLNDEKIGDAAVEYVPSADVTLAAHWTGFGTEEIFFCEGGSVVYDGHVYTSATTEEVTLSVKNQFGGDSIVTLTVTVNQPTFGTDTKTIVYGADESWNGISLKDSTVGVHYVVFETTNVAGCDSTVTLTLTVNKQATVEMEYPIEFCADDEQEYRGVVYTEAGSFPLELIEGTISDTLITVVVTVNDKMLTTEYVEDTIGNTIELPEGEWLLGETVYTESYELQEADLEGLEFIQIGQTEKGCEAVTKLVVTVNEKENQGGETTGVELINSDAKAMKELINGTLYIRRGERLFTAEGREVK